MKLKPIGLHVTELVPSTQLSPRLLKARVACRQAQAHFDALDGDPVNLAWAEVMDALWALVSEESP